MHIHQISVFLENRIGQLPEILVLPREKTPMGAAARGNP